jgi:hypothetical protein
VLNSPTTEIRPSFVASSALLRTWAEHNWHDGVRVDELSSLDRLIVTTENSTYDIVVLAPATAAVLVRGGAFFPVYTPVRVAGSSLGGSFLKLRSVHAGFRLEFSTGDGFIITSTVRTVAIAPAVTDPSDLM